jgi:hypothetical protein
MLTVDFFAAGLKLRTTYLVGAVIGRPTEDRAELRRVKIRRTINVQSALHDAYPTHVLHSLYGRHRLLILIRTLDISE